MNIELILAFMAVPVFLVAAIVNIIAAIRNGRERIGPLMISLLIAAISVWDMAGYFLISISPIYHISQNVNITLLRPANLFTGIVFAAIPTYLFTVSDESVRSERIEEALTKSKDCQETLKTVNERLLNREQAVEIYEFSYRTMKEKYEKALSELNQLKDGK